MDEGRTAVRFWPTLLRLALVVAGLSWLGYFLHGLPWLVMASIVGAEPGELGLGYPLLISAVVLVLSAVIQGGVYLLRTQVHPATEKLVAVIRFLTLIYICGVLIVVAAAIHE